MEKREMRFEDFLNDIHPDFEDAVTQIHLLLTQKGCLVKLQQAKSGFVVSYSHPGTKKVVANFVSRKKGPVIRIYGDFAATYQDFLDTLPEELEKAIAKAPACKRMLDPAKCNSRCPMGYDLVIKGTRHQKCRYNCFMFPVTAGHSSYIQAFLEREIEARSA